MEFWNQGSLLPPPTFTFKADNQNLDLLKLRNTLQDAIKHFNDEGFLQREALLLKRITYRMKMKFRSAKDFKSLEKISHAIDRYFKCNNMVSYLKLLVTLAPKEYYHDEIYLPTKNMFYYVFVKLQGLAKLMERIHDSCKVAAFLTSKRMSVGHFWKLSVIVFALISRIYVLVKYKCQFICDLYAKLHSHSVHLKNPGAEWLPKDYELPVDLRQWLGVQWVYEEEYIDLTEAELTQATEDFFDLCVEEDGDDVEVLDEYVLIDEDDELNDFRKLKQKKLEKSRLGTIDKRDRKENKKKRDKYRKETMRGFLDADCGEVIEIEDSFIDNVKANDIQDNPHFENIENYDKESQTSERERENMLDESTTDMKKLSKIQCHVKNNIEDVGVEINSKNLLKQSDGVLINNSENLEGVTDFCGNHPSIITISDSTVESVLPNDEILSQIVDKSKIIKKKKIKHKTPDKSRNTYIKTPKTKAAAAATMEYKSLPSKKRSLEEVVDTKTIKKLKLNKEFVTSTPKAKFACLSENLLDISAVVSNKAVPTPACKNKIANKKNNGNIKEQNTVAGKRTKSKKMILNNSSTSNKNSWKENRTAETNDRAPVKKKKKSNSPTFLESPNATVRMSIKKAKKASKKLAKQGKVQASSERKKVKKRENKSDCYSSTRNVESNENTSSITRKRKGHFANKANLKKKQVSEILCIDLTD